MLRVIPIGPLAAGSLLWQRHGIWLSAVACKVTFELSPGEAALAEEQEPINADDAYLEDDPARSVQAPADLVPFKARADVVLVGYAFAPRGEAVRQLVARMLVGDVDKAIEVTCDRAFTLDGALRDGPRFTRMPLRWERAAGGAGTVNPIGVSADAPLDAHGLTPLPNLLPVGFAPSRPGDNIPIVGFGPIAASWPSRHEKAARAGALPERWDHATVPAELEPAYFNCAPRDQQVERIREDERLVLENLHPVHGRLVTNLPGIRPRAFIARAGGLSEITLLADTLWIDTGRALCTVTWRGFVERPPAQGVVVAALEGPHHPLPWAELREAAASEGAAPPHAVEVPFEEAFEDAPPTPTRTLAGLLPEAPAGLHFEEVEADAEALDSEPPPTPPRGPSTLVPPPSLGAAPAPDLPFKPNDGTRPPPSPVALPPVALPPAAPLPAAPAPWRPRARVATLVDTGIPLDPSTSAVLPFAPPAEAIPAPRDTWPGLPAPQPMIAAPVLAPPPPPSYVPPAVSPGPSAPGSVWGAGLGGVGISLTAPAPPPPPARAPGGAALGGAAAASDAAADAPARTPASGRSASSAPAAEKAAPPRPAGGDVLDLIWFDPAHVARIRAWWEELCTELDFEEADPRGDPSADDPEQAKSRHNVFGIMSDGDVLDPSAVPRLVVEAVNVKGRFKPPLALLGGELRFPFDEVETLKATLVAVSPLVGSDKRLKESVESLERLAATPYLQGSSGVVERLTRELRDQFREGNRALPVMYLDTHVERLLLEQRRYSRRLVFGGEFLRALLGEPASPGGAAPAEPSIPVYLPKELDRVLPMLVVMKARLIVAAHLQQDPYEPSPYALRAVALARSFHLDGLRGGPSGKAVKGEGDRA